MRWSSTPLFLTWIFAISCLPIQPGYGVLEDASGRFLSYCIGWLDRANGFGHFEPVGCRPNFTGRGYARAVTIEGMRRMQARGMHTALVATGV
jgi:ribosomal protein S18 acetylase RimI-like enzyme